MSLAKPLVAAVLCLVPVVAAGGTDLGQRVSGTPYDHYMGSVFDVFGRFRQTGASVDSVRRDLRTARRFRYFFDESNPYVPQPPRVTEASHAGDCKAKSLWLAARMEDSETRFVIGRQSLRSRISHAWLLWPKDGEWYALASALADPDRSTRNAALRALGAAAPAARPHLPAIVATFLADSDAPPFATARALPSLGPVNAREAAIILGPAFHDDHYAPIIRLAACQAGGGEEEVSLLLRLLSDSPRAVFDALSPDEVQAAGSLLESLAASSDADPALDPLVAKAVRERLDELKAR